MVKERIGSLMVARDQARVDAERAAATLESSGQAITPALLTKFARTARERMRIDGGGYRRDHLRALAQRVEAADGEVRIMGSKGDLRRTLAAAPGVKSAAGGVRSSVPNWRREGDRCPTFSGLGRDEGTEPQCGPVTFPSGEIVIPNVTGLYRRRLIAFSGALSCDARNSMTCA